MIDFAINNKGDLTFDRYSPIDIFKLSFRTTKYPIFKIQFLQETFDGYCTEMEGAAVAHVCHILGTPFLIIRSISDKANHDAQMDYPEFVKIAAKNSKKMIEGILKETIWEESL